VRGEDRVKLDKLGKTLKRELAANPAKAGALGLLLLVGVYFWGPLIWKWVGKKGPTAAAASEAAPIAVAPPNYEQQGKGSTSTVPPSATWQELRRWRENDRLVQPAEFRSEWKDIFQVSVPAKVIPAEGPEAPKVEVKTVVISPQKAGLVLEGVAISSHSKRAIISGKVYSETDFVSASAAKDGDKTAGKGSTLSFKVVRITRRTVELERNGESFRLQLAAPDLAKQDAPDDKDLPEKP
jgi:hypothetical protein